jgi:hypothetical protein
MPYWHRRTRQGAGAGGGWGGWGGAKDGKPWKFGQTLGKIKKIQADLSENMLKSGYFITILHKYSGKLSTVLPPPPPPENISPVLLCVLMDFEASHDVEKVIH